MNNNNLPFRYPDELKKCFMSLLKLRPYIKTKNQALKYALRFSADCIENIIKKNKKIQEWDLDLEMHKFTGRYDNYFNFRPSKVSKKKVSH